MSGSTVSGFNAPARTSTWPAPPSRKSPSSSSAATAPREVHQTLYPIHRDREIVAFEWRPDQTAAVSATNPQLEGNVQLLTYSPSAPAAKRKRGKPPSSPPTAPDSPTTISSLDGPRDRRCQRLTRDAEGERSKPKSNTRLEVRQALRDVGDVVRHDAQSSFASVNARSAAGFKTRVSQRGIAVEQSIRKTTGDHPEYGAPADAAPDPRPARQRGRHRTASSNGRWTKIARAYERRP